MAIFRLFPPSSHTAHSIPLCQLRRCRPRWALGRKTLYASVGFSNTKEFRDWALKLALNCGKGMRLREAILTDSFFWVVTFLHLNSSCTRNLKMYESQVRSSKVEGLQTANNSSVHKKGHIFWDGGSILLKNQIAYPGFLWILKVNCNHLLYGLEKGPCRLSVIKKLCWIIVEYWDAIRIRTKERPIVIYSNLNSNTIEAEMSFEI